MSEVILTLNAYIDVFGNLTLKKEIHDKKTILLLLKKALEDEPLKAVITLKNKERVESLVKTLESIQF